MEIIAYLIPIALFLGLLGLAAFVWSMETGQWEDLDGAAMRVLHDDDGTIAPPDNSGRE
jgi:cbb3-type cytochrome oxidase maturation protein